MKKKTLTVIRLLITGVLLILLAAGCKKKDDSVTVTDVDGNVYHTVTIGTQVWLKEDLKTTRYRNGDLIGTTNPSTLDISGEINPKYQWAVDGDDANVAVYGRLYTWYAANDSRGLCPAGWHLPSETEWRTLIDNAGGESVAGGKLKEKGTSHWNNPNTGATDDFGFTGIPGGYRWQYGAFDYVGQYAFVWTSSQHASDPGYSYSFHLYWNDTYASSSNSDSANNGYSVRCLKD